MHPQHERLIGSFVFRRTENNFKSTTTQTVNDQQKTHHIHLKVLIVNKGTLQNGVKDVQDDSKSSNQEIESYLDELIIYKNHRGFLFWIEYDSQVEFEKEKEKNQFKQVLFTQDFLVVKIGNRVFYQKPQVVLHQNLQAYRDKDITYKDLEGLEWEEIKKERQKLIEQLLTKEQLLIEFSEVDLQGIDAHLVEGGVKIQNVASTHQTLQNGQKAPNLIQISLNDVTILWDLDGNREVSFLWHQHPLACSDNFVPTGFTLFKYSDQDRYMQYTDFFTQSDDGSLVLTSKTKSHRQQLFRLYRGMNLTEIKALQSAQHLPKFIPYSTYLAIFNNMTTFFHILRDKHEFMELLVRQLERDKLKDKKEVDESAKVSDNILIRKLYWTLRMKLIEHTEEQAQKHNQKPQKSIETENTQKARINILNSLMRDKENTETIEALVQILQLSSEKRLSDLAGTFDCFTKALELQSDDVNTFISEAFPRSHICEEIETFDWFRGHKLLSFSSKNSLINKKTIRSNFEIERNRELPLFTKAIKRIFEVPLKTTPVEVRIIEISWLADNLPKFYKYLRNYDGEDLIQSQIIKLLLESQYYSNQLMKRIALPYLAYILGSLVYFSVFVPYSVVPQHGFWGGPGEREQAALRVFVSLGAVLISAFEIVQIRDQGKNYLKDFWNYLIWAANILSIGIVIEQGTGVIGITRELLIQLSSLEVILQWGFAYYWVRLFPELAFYVNMVQETIRDCAYFILILLGALLMFGNAFYTLQGIPSLTSEGEEGKIWDDYFNVSFIDATFAYYMIGLGEFSYDDWAAHPSGKWIWLYFCFGTFFTQIMFFNMLIAMMGSTLARVTENREKASLIERVTLYTDWYWAINFSEKHQNAPYLYVMTPKADDSQEREAAAAEAMRQTILKEICERDDKQQKRQEAMNAKIDRQETMNSNTNSKIDILEKKMDRQEMKMDELQETNKKIIQLIEMMNTKQ